MKKHRDEVTAERLREVLDYVPETGEFFWRSNPSKKKEWDTKWAGKRAGFRAGGRQGYIQIFVDGRLYLGHRLAWLYHYGVFPSKGLDHIDGDSQNNTICNLREASQAQNTCNQKTPRHNTSGYKGVTWDKSRNMWLAHLKKGYRRVFQKRFQCKKDAIDAVTAAREFYHGDFCRHS